MSTSGDAFRRFERRMRRRLSVKVIAGRAWASVPAAIQIVAGVLISYSIAHFLIGHATPLLSVTVVISTLGFARDARPRRVLESTVGILIGIVLSEALVLLVGRGVWQIAVVLFVTLVIARAVSASPAFAVASATQGMLVMILPSAQGGPFARSEDAAVAGVIALVLTAVIPRDTRRIAVRDARALTSTLSQAMASMLEGIDESNEPAANMAFERLRKTQDLVNNWGTSLESAIAVAKISPFLRKQLPELRQQQALLTGLDLTVRHLRVISRRVLYLLREGPVRPEIAELLRTLERAIELVGASIEDPPQLAAGAAILRELAPKLDPDAYVPGAPVTESVFVLLARPLVVDLLVATGMRADDARALLPAHDHPVG